MQNLRIISIHPLYINMCTYMYIFLCILWHIYSFSYAYFPFSLKFFTHRQYFLLWCLFLICSIFCSVFSSRIVNEQQINVHIYTCKQTDVINWFECIQSNPFPTFYLPKLDVTSLSVPDTEISKPNRSKLLRT